MWGAILDSLCRLGRSVRPSVRLQFVSALYLLYSWKDFLLGDVQSPCCPCVISRSWSQLKVKYQTTKYYTLCCVRSITPLLMEGFPSNLNDTFTLTRGCAKHMLPMCQLKVKVTVQGQILNKQILDIMSCPLYKPYANEYSCNGRISFKLS